MRYQRIVEQQRDSFTLKIKCTNAERLKDFRVLVKNPTGYTKLTSDLSVLTNWTLLCFDLSQ